MRAVLAVHWRGREKSFNLICIYMNQALSKCGSYIISCAAERLQHVSEVLKDP